MIRFFITLILLTILSFGARAQVFNYSKSVNCSKVDVISIDITLDSLQNEGQDKYRIYYTFDIDLFKNGNKIDLDSQFSTCELEIEMEIEIEILCQNLKFISEIDIDREFENGFGSNSFIVNGKTKKKKLIGQNNFSLQSLNCDKIKMDIDEVEIEFDDCNYSSDECEIEIEDEVTLKAIESGLPIELITFDAIKKDRQVELSWKTATETNNDFFTIARSVDGKYWEDLQYIEGAGNSVQVQDYSYTDDAPYAGISYYRLTQTDFDGTQKTFPIVSVEQKDLEVLQAYPNPVVHTVTLMGVKENQAIRIFNAVGIEVTENTQVSISPSKKTLINMNDLPKGVYYIVNGAKQIKVLKQ